jgi:8-oxo-dGTP pyrophosphatase MutT (NUDIX family)
LHTRIPLHHLRALWQYLRVWLRTAWGLAFTVVGIAVTVAGAVSGSSPVTVVGAVFLVITLVVLVADIRTVRDEIGDLYSQELHDVNYAALTRGRQSAAAELVVLDQGSALVQDAVCERIATAHTMASTLLPHEYELPRNVRWAGDKALVEAWRRGRRDFDAPKVRLCSDLDVEEQPSPISVQRTRFVYARVTNDLATTRFVSRRNGRTVLGPDDVPFPHGTVPDLAMSVCSNHIGVDTVTFLRTGQLVLGVQSPLNEQSPGLLASSGSGSADWADLIATGGEDLLVFLRRAMARELCEECGLDDDVVDERGTEVIGFARFLHRGGKPQFFGVTPTDIGQQDLQRRGQERRYVDDFQLEAVDWSSLAAWAMSLRDLLDRRRREVSVPLHLNVELLARWAERHPARYDTLRERFT